MFENEEIKKTETVYSERPYDAEEKGKPEDREGGRPPFRRNARPGAAQRGGSDKRKFFLKKKVCFFCKNKEILIDYKDVNLMRRFVAESGKIVPRRFSGTCAKHQRKLSTEIKKARQMALIPYTDR